MTLGEFHSLVSTAINRGTSLDARIPSRVKMAAMWLERNYTFQYMERFRLLQVVAADRTVELPTNEIIKGFKFVRLINDDDTYSTLKKVQALDLLGLDAGVPTSFWTVRNSIIVFNSVPDTDLSGEAMWYAYTDWPVETGSEHELLDVAADVLMAQTLMLMAAFDTRDSRMVAAYKQIRDEGVNTLTRAEDEARYSGESMSMQYVP